MVFTFFHCSLYALSYMKQGVFFLEICPSTSLNAAVSLEHRLFVCAKGKALHEAVQGIGPQGSTMTPDIWDVHLKHLVDNSPW